MDEISTARVLDISLIAFQLPAENLFHKLVIHRGGMHVSPHTKIPVDVRRKGMFLEHG